MNLVDFEVPLVSVVIAVYKNVADFKVTLETVLNQSLEHIEVIVVDDGNCKEDQAKLRLICGTDQRVNLIENRKNKGLTECLIQGVNEAQGSYIARIDNGDLMVPSDRLMSQHEALELDPDLVIVGGNIEVVDTLNRFRFRSRIDELVPKLYDDQPMSNLFFHVAVMFRKDIYHLAGGYNPKFRVGQDSELWPRMLRYGRGKNFPDIVAIAPMARHSISVGLNNQQVLKKIKRLKDSRADLGFFKYIGKLVFESLKLLLPVRLRVFLRYVKNMNLAGVINVSDCESLALLKRFYEEKGYF